MKPRHYYLETFGCQMNILDSQLVEGQLRVRGMTPTGDMENAELILFNTCSVRQHAEDKVLSRLGRLKKHKATSPETIIGVIGCMAEREKEGIFVRAPHVDLLCGPGELNRLPELIDEVQARNQRVTALAGSLSRRTEVMARALEYDSLEALDLSRTVREGESMLQSYIRVQRGCDKFCTYCVVPFTRGPERSRPPEHIVQEARLLADRGCREITLLGQTVNSYVHQEDGKPVPFAKLLERVHAVDGIDRIRFVTSFPADWDEDISRVMRDCPKIMPYLHIPAQSGSDRVLKRMRRTYTAGRYAALMDTARKYVPDIALAGDMIVGFCGETDEDHRASLDLLRRVEYKSVFVFKYSPRPGTVADRNLEDDISNEVKQARMQEIMAVQAEISAEYKKPFVGKTVPVLVEGFSKLHGKPSVVRREGDTWVQESEQDRGSEVSNTATGQLVGRTPHDLIVVFEAPSTFIGSIVDVYVERTTALTLFGRVTGVISPPRAPKVGDSPAPPSNKGVSLPLLGTQSSCQVEAHPQA